MGKLNNQELITFCDQLHLVIRSGISSLEGIAIMREDAVTPSGRSILDNVYEGIEETGSLGEAVSASGAFPEYMVHMISLGERSGKLEEVLAALASYYAREENIGRSIRSAVTYPLVMLGILFVVVIVLMTKVLPVFEQVFAQLGTSMNGISLEILNIGKMMNRSATAFIIVLIVVAVLCAFFAGTKKGRSASMHFLQSFGPGKAAAEKIACARFADGMSLTLGAGLDMDESLALISGLVGNKKFRGKIESCRAMMQDGKSLSESMQETGIFPGIYAHMASVGFKTGTLEEVMRKIADNYEQEIDAKIQNTVSVLEPTLVSVLAVIVGIILLSVMLPLTGIMSGIS